MNNKNWKLKIAIIAGLMINWSAVCQAGGLRTAFGEVVIRNIKIGQSYSMYKLVNLPLRVVNTGDEEAELRIETVKASVINEGYEAIPSLDWVKIERGSFTVLPNREAVTDVVINIPNDTKLLGRRFQADIWSHTIDRRTLLVGLKSRLLIQIDSTPPSEEELKKKYVDESLANLDFTISPINFEINDVVLGHDIDLKKEHKLSLKLINPNDRDLNFRVRSIPVWESLILPPAGYTEAQNPGWLKPEKDIVKVEASSINQLGLHLELPNQESLRDKNLFFIVSFEVLEQKIPTRVYFRLMVHTAK